MNTPLVINIDTGVISFRTDENADQCNCRPISAKHAQMVSSGELPIEPLLAAIKKHMMSAESFNYDAYADSRRSLNVRHSALHADERAPVADASPEEYVSDDEVTTEMSNTEKECVDAAVIEVARKKTNRKATASKESVAPTQTMEATLPLGD